MADINWNGYGGAGPLGPIVSVGVKEVIDKFAAESRSAMAAELSKFTRALQSDKSSVSNGMRTLHEHVGQGAKKAVLEGYANSGIGRGESYRDQAPGKLRRYSRGAMERALNNPGMVTHDSTRLNFVNNRSMDRLAKQWYRLNFGAKSRGQGGRAPAIKSWKMGRKQISFTLSLEAYDASQGFRVPQSSWYTGAWSNIASPTNLSYKELRPGLSKVNTNRGDYLYLVTRKKVEMKTGKRAGSTQIRREPNTFNARVSKGIQGAHFLEKGVDYINYEYPRQLYNLMDTWFTSATNSGGQRKPFVWKPI